MANYNSTNTGAVIDAAVDAVEAVSGDLVGTTDTQTLTNKTLNNPNINEAVALTATSTQLNTITDKADKNVTIQTKSANYTLVAGDNNNIIEVDTTSTITLPDGLDTGFQAVIVNTGSGQTITLSATTTLTSKDSATTITSQYGAVTVVHVGSNVWRAFGDLA
jgi:tRNA U34 5-carboxymethylaminomethyl modifying enzyme MnmG/GidA